MRSFGETPGKREALLNKLVKISETPVKREETPEKGEEPKFGTTMEASDKAKKLWEASKITGESLKEIW